MSPLSQTDIANLALMRLGQRKVMSITNATDPNAIACLVAWPQALGEVSREAPWNCLKKRAWLEQLVIPQTGAPVFNLPASTVWAPAAVYAAGDYVTFGSPPYLYQCLIANTSTSNFTNDLTQGWWFQTTYFWPNFLGPPAGNAIPTYEFRFAYELPDDFVMAMELNGNWVWGGRAVGSLYEIYQKALFCNSAYADLKYTAFETDTTNFDPLFTGALVLNLAGMIATTLRKDDARLSLTLRQEYQAYLQDARQKNGAEGKPRRYNIVSESRFVRSRRWSTNS